MSVTINDNDLLQTLAGLSITTLSIARLLEMKDVIPVGSTAQEIRRRIDRLPENLKGTSTEKTMNVCVNWLESDEESDGGELSPFALH